MRRTAVALAVAFSAFAQESDIDKELEQIEAEIAAQESRIQELSGELAHKKEHPLATEPERIEFTSQTGSKDFFVFDGADMVPAKDLKSVQIAGKSYVQEMFKISRGEGGYDGITVSTVPGKVEAGTYTVEVVTARGKAALTIETNFGGKQKIATGPLRETFSIALPAQYQVGCYLDLTTGGSPSTYYTWKVHGKTVLEGVGKSRMRYVLTKPGKVTVSAEERYDDNSVSSWSGTTNVVPEKLYTHSIKKGQEFALDTTFLGLTGFAEHVWFLDGKRIGPGASFKMKFPQPGTYRVTCLATKPTVKNSVFGMREVTYQVDVK